MSPMVAIHIKSGNLCIVYTTIDSSGWGYKVEYDGRLVTHDWKNDYFEFLGGLNE